VRGSGVVSGMHRLDMNYDNEYCYTATQEFVAQPVHNLVRHNMDLEKNATKVMAEVLVL